jgi:uncharacterized phage infection (PIP) family protein YhgE
MVGELKKHPRSLRLDGEINRKLEEICKAFGTNANSYILNELGKAIVRDYQTINIQNASDSTFAAISQMFSEISAEAEKIKEISKD